MNATDVKVKAESSVNPGDAWTLPHRIVMWEDSKAPEGRNMVTHTEIMTPGLPAYFVLGHYDLDLFRAIKDYEARCRQHNVEPWAQPINA